jgi:hypothetical protein
MELEDIKLKLNIHTQLLDLKDRSLSTLVDKISIITCDINTIVNIGMVLNHIKTTALSDQMRPLLERRPQILHYFHN